MSQVLTAALLSATTLLVPLECGGGPETANESDGEHEMIGKADNANYPMNHKITFAAKWQACTWYIETQDADGAPRVRGKSGTENDFAYVVWQDGRKAWITLKGCGRAKVHK